MKPIVGRPAGRQFLSSSPPALEPTPLDEKPAAQGKKSLIHQGSGFFSV
jgi:hypothetical protein